MHPNAQSPRRQAGGGVVREEDRVLARQGKPDGSLFPAVQGERSDQYLQRRCGGSTGGLVPEIDLAVLENLRPVKLDLFAHRFWYDDAGEIEEQVEAADFVEVNQGAGITDDLGFRVSHFPEGPT